jgi:hypothetical protein
LGFSYTDTQLYSVGFSATGAIAIEISSTLILCLRNFPPETTDFKSIDLLHKYFGVAKNTLKKLTQRQASALGGSADL